MATGTASAPVAAPAVGTGPIFKFDVAANPTPWKKDMVVEIKQINQIAPTEPELKPYLLIYEADKAVWNEKTLGKDDDLEAILAIQGEFDDAGKFSVTKTIPLHKSEHGLTIEIKLKDKDGGAVKLKDKDGADLAKLLLTLPAPDTDDETWELDLALFSSAGKERRQDRLVLGVP